METNLHAVCPNCNKPLSTEGYFCGTCLTQIRCKSCGTFLEKDYLGCTNCGTPKEIRNNINANTFRLHETATDRTIEATFSDMVGKDLAGILRDASANRMKAISLNGFPQQKPNGVNNEKDSGIFTELEVVNNENGDVDLSKEERSQEKLTQQPQSTEYPTLKAIAMKNLPSTETEWIVVYAFYASNYGKDTFSRQAIIDNYRESNRKNKERIKGLSAYLVAAVRGGYINPLEDSFSILDKGVEKAKEIIIRTSSSYPKPKTSSPKKKENTENNTEIATRAKKTSNGGKNLKRLTNLNFEPTDKECLKDFFSNYSAKNDNERNLIFVHYLQNVLEIKEITFDHIYSCYDVLELRISENLQQTIRNTASRTGWVEIKKTKLSVTVKGSNQNKSWIKKN